MKTNDFAIGPVKTGYSKNGYYQIGQDDLSETSLYSLELLCSQMKGQLSDEDIQLRHKEFGDYDENVMWFNVFANGFLIQFHFDLYGLHVEYNAWELKRNGHTHTATPSVVTKVVDAVAEWLMNYNIEDISETFYEMAEQGIAWQIVEEFKFGKHTAC